MPASFILQLENLAARRQRRTIFQKLALSVANGGVAIVTGANGSGKSTLLRLVAGLVPAAAGTMRWNNISYDPASTDHRARINYIGHLDAVKSGLTAAQQLAYWQTLDPPGFRQPPSSLLATVGLAGLDDYPIRILSAGQKRRLSLTRLLMRPALLWLLDEPATALDNAGQSLLADRIAAHRAAGGAAIIATHQPLDIPQAKRLDLNLLASASPANTTTGVWT